MESILMTLKSETMSYGQSNKFDYASTDDETDFDCPKYEGNHLEEIDNSI